MSSDHRKPGSLSTLMGACAESGRWQRAFTPTSVCSTVGSNPTALTTTDYKTWISQVSPFSELISESTKALYDKDIHITAVVTGDED